MGNGPYTGRGLHTVHCGIVVKHEIPYNDWAGRMQPAQSVPTMLMYYSHRKSVCLFLIYSGSAIPPLANG